MRVGMRMQVRELIEEVRVLKSLRPMIESRGRGAFQDDGRGFGCWLEPLNSASQSSRDLNNCNVHKAADNAFRM